MSDQSRTRRLDEAPLPLAPKRHVPVVISRAAHAELHLLNVGDVVVVGRAAPADIIVDDDALSRQHLRLEATAVGLSVCDLGSTNGTLVRIDQGVTPLVPHVLVSMTPGARLLLGTTQIFCVLDEAGGGSGLLPHGAFTKLLHTEVARAQRFRRPLTLAHVRTTRDVGDVIAVLAKHHHMVDSAGIWAGGHYELLWPELDHDAALARAKAMTRAFGDDSAFSVATFPTAATSAGGLEAAVVAGATRAVEEAGGRAVWSAPSSAQATASPATSERVVVSPTMLDLFSLVRRLARSRIPVLIHGETGVGKEVVARALHGDGDDAKSKPFFAVNCGGLPSTLVEATLFGHEKGAFTGADQRRVGVFELAHGGTLFLDEVAELPPSAQTALLRVLESRQLRRIGGSADITVDVRVVAASHKDLAAAVAAGTFREDLLYRMNSFVLEVPPLRERREDIPGLAQRFVEDAAVTVGRPLRLSPEALSALVAGTYPGNVRELKNVIERAAVLCDGDVIETADLPEHFADAPSRIMVGPVASAPSNDLSATVVNASGSAVVDDPALPLAARLDHLERQILQESLNAHGGDTAASAEALGLPRRTLQHRLKVLGVRLSR